MRVLILTGSSAADMVPPQLGDTQIVAGPSWPDAQTADGHWISLRTPIGEYDIATLLAKIPAAQMLHAIVNLADASWLNMPSNMAAFEGAKTLLIMDSEKLVFPLAEMFRYIGTEYFERVAFLQGKDQLGLYLADLAAEFTTNDTAHESAFTHAHHPQLVKAS